MSLTNLNGLRKDRYLRDLHKVLAEHEAIKKAALNVLDHCALHTSSTKPPKLVITHDGDSFAIAILALANVLGMDPSESK